MKYLQRSGSCAMARGCAELISGGNDYVTARELRVTEYNCTVIKESLQPGHQTVQAFAIGTGHGQTCSILESQERVAVKERLPLFDPLQIYERGPADAEELFRCQPGLRRIHRFTEQMRLPAHMQTKIVSLGLDPVNFLRLEESDPP